VPVGKDIVGFEIFICLAEMVFSEGVLPAPLTPDLESAIINSVSIS